jgi:hypothetical protein
MKEETMKNQILCLVYAVALTFCVIVTAAQSLNAQQQSIRLAPTALYRFRISDTNLGYLLTGLYSQGLNSGSHPYTLDYVNSAFHSCCAAPALGPYGIVGGIYRPPSGYEGWIPDSNSGLIPIYQWTVIEHGRAYTYLSTTYAVLGGNYTYDGIIGYAFNPNETNQHIYSSSDGYHNIPIYTHLSSFYSQSYGYWNGDGIGGFESLPELPPGGTVPQGGTFNYQSNVAALPAPYQGTAPGQTCAGFQGPPPCLFFYPDTTPNEVFVNFYPPPPPPPPPSCDPDGRRQQSCEANFGFWDEAACRCRYQP